MDRLAAIASANPHYSIAALPSAVLAAPPSCWHRIHGRRDNRPHQSYKRNPPHSVPVVIPLQQQRASTFQHWQTIGIHIGARYRPGTAIHHPVCAQWAPAAVTDGREQVVAIAMFVNERAFNRPIALLARRWPRSDFSRHRSRCSLPLTGAYSTWRCLGTKAVAIRLLLPAGTQPKSKCFRVFQPFELLAESALEPLSKNLLPSTLRGTPPPTGVRI